MTLYIGAYYPDRELVETPIGEAVTRVAACLAKYRSHTVQSSKPNLELCYMIPSALDAPDFKGMRFHSFDADSDTLRLETSVPEAMVKSRHAEAYVIAALQDAVDNAFDFYSSEARLFRRDEYQIMIESLRNLAAEGETVKLN